MTDEIRAIAKRHAALPDLDARTPEEIIGFDDHGVPANITNALDPYSWS